MSSLSVSSAIEALLSLLSQHPLYLVVFGAVILFVVGRLRQFWRLKQFDGPFSTGFSWLWHSNVVLSGNAHKYYGDVTEKYGTIARVAPNHLITSSPDLWAHMNAVRSPYSRSPWYYHCARFEAGKDNVFTECDNDKHDVRRKKMASGYSGKENPTLEPSIDTHVKELVHLIRSKYATQATSASASKPMNMAKKMQYFTLDVISHVGLGQAFGDLKEDADVNDYLKATEEGLAISNTSWALGIAWIRDVPILGKAISPTEEDERGFGKMMAHARKSIEQRLLKSTSERSDMLSSFVRHGLFGDALFHETFEQILAGSDTTAASLRIIMLYLMSHPRVYAKLQAEIDSAVNAGIAPASPGIISDAEARGLVYLGAVIREALRVHPPVVNIFSRVVPKDGDAVRVDGQDVFLPGGTLIGYSAWGMHRNNKALYGEDAHVFRPERWFVDEKEPGGAERLAQMLKTNDMIFGYGKWHCLGKVVAMIEIHKVIFELLRNFDFALTNPSEPWTISNAMGLFAIGNMWVEVTERS
ncbi:pisatin demethylase [Mytilinidion resinicola]|uniref:Cytochrome P450 monooxygenase ABA1 n=1 Tax=Mytilinidion resinicola TaxID=574789 RepID=A0A6A6ZAE7_9PEZI|nr:pisatin demethylase [Mytilinidion resinicola]KAF2817669.1 pisatin demethylase [Mytilinidion resinicola]